MITTSEKPSSGPMELQVERHVRPESIARELRKVIPGCFISEGSFASRSPGLLVDQQWNHMDQAHRETIHHAYFGAMRIASGRDFAISVTRQGNLPVFIPVTDLRITPTLSYQIFSVFGLIWCHQVSQSTEDAEGVELRVNWYTASHWLFKPLHGFFNRMLYRLHKKQFGEDLPVRVRRGELRKKAVRFETDCPNYLNSNKLDDHVILPAGEFTAPIPQLEIEERRVISVGPADVMLERVDMGFKVWPAFCAHEGAAMNESHMCEGKLVCPWHLRRFNSALLDLSGTRSARICNGKISVVGNELHLVVP